MQSEVIKTFPHSYAADLAMAGDRAIWIAYAACETKEEELFADYGLRPWRFADGYGMSDWKQRNDETRYRIYLTRRDVERGDVEFHQLIAESRGYLMAPKVALDADLEPYVVWGEKREGVWGVYMKHSKWGEHHVAGSGRPVFGPQCCCDAVGRIWIVWQERVDERFVIYARRFSAGDWTEQINTSKGVGSSWQPSISADRSGSVWVAWDAFDGRTYNIYCRQCDASGKSSAPAPLSCSDEYDMSPDLTTDRDGNAWVSWSRTSRWGKNHRFNEHRQLHVIGVDHKSKSIIELPNSEPEGLIPLDVVSFTNSVSAEYIVPMTPRLFVGAQGQTHVFYRQLRSKAAKDYGWQVRCLTREGSGWSEPQLVTTESGAPDFPIGLTEDAQGRIWLAHHCCDHVPALTEEELAMDPRPPRRSSRPVSRSRVEVLRISNSQIERNIPKIAPVPAEVKSYQQETISLPKRDGRTITFAGETYQLLWGDMHRHTQLSKCMSANDGDVLDNYRWSMDVEATDFWAITEHIEYTGYDEWRRVEKAASMFFDEGNFSPLFAFEMAKPPGHTNFFYRNQEYGEELRRLSIAAPSLEKLFEEIHARFPKGEIIAARHHQGHGEADAVKGYSPEFEPAMEIMQTRGEFRDFVERFLSAGCKIGFVGATDHAREWAFPYCMTAVWAKRNSRDSIFEALWDHRCCSSSTKILLFFNVSEIMMGHTGEVTGPPELHVIAEGTTELDELHIYRNNELIHSEPLEARKIDLTYTDRDAREGESYYYYLRIAERPQHGSDRQGVAYASPVWVKVV